jgi:hypothetical protein
MKRIAPILFAAFALAACGPAAPPTPSEAQVQAAMSRLLTEQAALWTATFTPLPPPATFTLEPTFTPAPSDTPAPLASNTPVPSPTDTPVAGITDTPLPSRYEGMTALLKLENTSGQEIYIVIYGTAYYEIRFSGTEYKIEDAPWGDYNYTAWIGSDGPYTGFFRITNWDKHTLKFQPGKVTFLGP